MTISKGLRFGFVLVTALGAAAVAACTAEVTTNNATDGGVDGAVNKNDGGTPTDGAATGDGSGDTDTGTPASTKGGSIQVSETLANSDLMQPASTTLTASFFDSVPAPGPSPLNCTEMMADTCKLTTCTKNAAFDAGTPDPDAGTPTIPDSPNAGDITVTGGKIPAAGLTISPKEHKLYTGGTDTTYGKLADLGFDDGDVLTVKATGAGGIMAFMGKTVKAPTSVILSPIQCMAFQCTFGGTAPMDGLDTTKALDLTWPQDSADTTVSLILNTNDSSNQSSATITCAWNAAAKKGTIAASLLGGLLKTNPPPGGTISGFASASFTTTSLIQDGDYAITFGASVSNGTQGSFKTM